MLQEHIWKASLLQEQYSKHASGAVCISNMVLGHIWLRKLFQIINGPGQCGPGAYDPRPYGLSWGQNLQKNIEVITI